MICCCKGNNSSSEDLKMVSQRNYLCGLSHHVNGFVDDDILDLVHLNERGGLPARGVAGGHLDAQGANDQQRLVVYFHKVDVKRHADQGDEDGTGQHSCVLQKRGEGTVN